MNAEVKEKSQDKQLFNSAFIVSIGGWFETAGRDTKEARRREIDAA